MKPIRQITITAIILAVLVTVYSPLRAKNFVKPKAYMFGFSASFNDSIVYFTDIQEVDSVWFMQKNDILAGRRNYSNQLRNYFAEKLKMPHRTCVVSFGKDRKDAEKKYLKLKKLYAEKNAGRYDIRYLSENDFKFTTVAIDDE